MDENTGIQRRVVQPRRLHALGVPIAMIVVAVIGMAMAGMRAFADGGYILLVIAFMGGLGTVYVMFRCTRAPMLEADAERVVVRSMLGRENVVETKSCELVISVDYIAFRDPQGDELAVQRGFFGFAEWNDQIKELRSLPFKVVVEGEAQRN